MIVGPTAVGKTAVAVELASVIGGEIVSADSMAVYKDMDIGTAKPTSDEKARARFHLIDVVEPTESFSVGEFAGLAQNAIDDILSRGLTPIVVGGSGLYVRAAIDGLDDDIPASDDDYREKLRELAREHGVEYVHGMLADIDPVWAERIHPNNLKRVIRALEIHHCTGSTPSALFEEDAKRPPRYPNARFFGLTMERKTLYERIEKRVDAMIQSGLVEEVRKLIGQISDPNSTAMQGLGYKEIAVYLRGEVSLDEAIDLLKKNTRRFAKRQYTWFRADERIKWVGVDGRSAAEVSNIIKEFLSV